MKEEIYSTNDKWKAPFLLAASFQGLVSFETSSFQDGKLFWKFRPLISAQKLLDQFRTKTEPRLPARDLFEATETWWKQVAEMKERGMKIGQTF